MAHATVVRAGAREDDDEAIRIAYLIQGDEHICEIAPPGTDYAPLLERLVNNLNVPVDAVRAYRGAQLLEEQTPNLR